MELKKKIMTGKMNNKFLRIPKNLSIKDLSKYNPI